MQGGATSLEYGRQPTWRRRITRRQWVCLAVVTALIISGVRWGRFVGERVQLLWWQKKCLRWQTAANVKTYQQFVVGSAPGEWIGFKSRVAPGGGAAGALIFMHEMKGTDGKPRLVAIEIPNRPISCNHEFDCYIFEPGTFARPPRLISSQTETMSWYVTPRPDPQSLTLYGATVDPDDPDQFIIRYSYLRWKGKMVVSLDYRNQIRIDYAGDEDESATEPQ